MVISQLLVNFIPDHATKHRHFIVNNFRKTFHLFLEYGELPALPILQITFNNTFLSFKNSVESMGLKEKTVNFLLFSGTTKNLGSIAKLYSLLSDPLICLEFY